MKQKSELQSVKDLVQKLRRARAWRAAKRGVLKGLALDTILVLLFLSVDGGSYNDAASQVLATLLGALFAVWVGRSAARQTAHDAHGAQSAALVSTFTPYFDATTGEFTTILKNIASGTDPDGSHKAKERIFAQTKLTRKTLAGLRDAFVVSPVALLMHHQLDYFLARVEEQAELSYPDINKMLDNIQKAQKALINFASMRV